MIDLDTYTRLRNNYPSLELPNPADVIQWPTAELTGPFGRSVLIKLEQIDRDLNGHIVLAGDEVSRTERHFRIPIKDYLTVMDIDRA